MLVSVGECVSVRACMRERGHAEVQKCIHACMYTKTSCHVKTMFTQLHCKRTRALKTHNNHTTTLQTYDNTLKTHSNHQKYTENVTRKKHTTLTKNTRKMYLEKRHARWVCTT